MSKTKDTEVRFTGVAYGTFANRTKEMKQETLDRIKQEIEKNMTGYINLPCWVVTEMISDLERLQTESEKQKVD